MIFSKMTQADLDYMRDHSTDNDLYKSIPETIEHNFALRDGNDVLGIGGIRMMNDTTGVGWFDLSRKGFENVIACYRTISEWIGGYTDGKGNREKGICQELGIVRLEAYVKDGFGRGVRTVEHLDFAFERKVHKYFGDQDGLLFVRYF